MLVPVGWDGPLHKANTAGEEAIAPGMVGGTELMGTGGRFRAWLGVRRPERSGSAGGALGLKASGARPG